MHVPSLVARLALRSAVLASAVLCFQWTAQAEDQSQLRMPESLRIATTPGEYQTYDFLRDEEESELSEGAIEIVRERYPDGNVKIERHVTLDAEGNYVNHGVWRMMSAKGNVIAEGQYDMGKRVGTWSKWLDRNESRMLSKFPFNQFQAPFVSQANFVDDVMHGEWVIVDAKQRNCMQISLNMGERDGPSITWLPNGKTYHQMTYDDGKPVGDVLELKNRKGELERTASYVDGRKVVTNTTYYRGRRKQKQTEQSFLAATTVPKTSDDFWNFQFAEFTSEGEDLLHGPSLAWYANGKPQSEGTYDYGKKSGNFTYWHENGQIAATGEFNDDVPEDVWVWWHANGQKAAVGKYQHGLLVGDWRWWGADGQLAKQSAFDAMDKVTSDPQDVVKLGERPAESEQVVR